MKKNFHWLIFCLIAISFWRCSDDLFYNHRVLTANAAGELSQYGWIVTRTVHQGSNDDETLVAAKILRLRPWSWVNPEE